jgi:hypothetical protein
MQMVKINGPASEGNRSEPPSKPTSDALLDVCCALHRNGRLSASCASEFDRCRCAFGASGIDGGDAVNPR